MSWSKIAPLFSRGIAFTVILSALAIHSASAQADPVAFAQKVGNTAIRDLTDPKLSDADRVKRMRELLKNVFDEKAVSKFVLGPYVRRTTPEQFKEFVKLYGIYVAHNYAGLFKRYNGERIDMQSAVKLSDGDSVVNGVIVQPDGPKISIEMRLRPEDNTFKAVDLKVEGVSMPLTHRKQFASVINQHGGKVQGLIDALKGAIKRFDSQDGSQ